MWKPFDYKLITYRVNARNSQNNNRRNRMDENSPENVCAKLRNLRLKDPQSLSSSEIGSIEMENLNYSDLRNVRQSDFMTSKKQR